MKYIKKDLGSFNVHFIKTKKFKTTTIRVVFHTPIQRDEITKRNFLTNILLQSSKKYDSRRKLTIESEELYSADLSAGNQRLGNYIFTSFNLQILNDNYTEDGNLEKSLEFLSEIIYHPDFDKVGFKQDKFDIVKTDEEVAINSLKENPARYSLIRAFEAYDKESPISYRMNGYIEDIEKITKENLRECYQNMIDNDYVDMFVVGNYDTKEMLLTIKKYFKFKKIKKQKDSYLLDVKKCRKRRLFARETIDNKQSKLVIVCPIAKLKDYEKNYPLVLANLILGGGAESKLFKEVREKKSLCYSIYSMYYKLDNLLIIMAGIDKANFDETVELITENLSNMKKGKITEKEIQIAKEYYHTSAMELEDNEYQMITEILMQEILGLEPIKERVKKMNEVTKSEIIKACKKINMDTVFLLEGVKNERD